MDGVFTISPKKGITIKTYCDMVSQGGGWTLLVSSHTPTWSNESIRERNINSPSVTVDYSMLKYADDVKDNYLITHFEYKLEAHSRG